MKKICTSRGQKGENRPPDPKKGIWGPKSVSIGNFTWSKKKYTFGA
jgi:hypothetical protein